MAVDSYTNKGRELHREEGISAKRERESEREREGGGGLGGRKRSRVMEADMYGQRTSTDFYLVIF